MDTQPILPLLPESQALVCENCDQPHDCSFGSGRFCSSVCAKSFSTKDKISRPRNFRDPGLFTKAGAIADLSRVERGVLAEDFVYYQLRRRGIEVYRPQYPKEHTDFVIVSGPVLRRCEVKSTCAENLAVGLRRTQYVDGQYTQTSYVEADVDFFFLVDLIHEHVFVAPKSVIAASPHIMLTPGSRIWAFKDRYDILSE